MAGSQQQVPDARNERVLINLNGALVPRAEARVSIYDGAFVCGDGIWEGIRLHKGTLMFLDQHLDRLYWGASHIRLDIGMDRAALTAELKRTLAANQMHDGVHVRLMVTRGEKSALNQDPRNALGRATVAIAAEYKVPAPSLATTGASLATSSVLCTPASMFDMRLNSHSRLNLIGALLQAIDAGADEALMLDPNGFVSSCNATNFFFVKDGVIKTSTGEYCFNGITRGNVMRLCQQANLPLQSGEFTLAEAQDADEAFLTGTFGGITPVREIDGRVLSSTLPGPVTQRVRELYAALRDAQAKGAGAGAGAP
jgi:branched-chain amino acid aminotransferase